MSFSHLILHFDVNKSMIMLDPIQGKDVVHTLNDLLAETCYGHINTQDGKWQWNRRPPSSTTPSSSSSSREGGRETLVSLPISYAHYLRQTYPTASLSPSERHRNKQTRRDRRQQFSCMDAELTRYLEELKAALTLPLHVQRSVLAQEAGLCTEYMYILPSFYELIWGLHRSGRRFNLVLRTYGQDLGEIAKEFNAFCEGRHPLYLDWKVSMDGRHDSIDRRIHLHDPEGVGMFYRNDSEHETTRLIMGCLHQPPNDPTMSHTNAMSHFEPLPHVNQVHGFHSIVEYLNELYTRRATVALRDYYPWWWQNEQDARAGKLMVIDRNNECIHSVFFDDNILHQEAHIVDARDTNGESIPFKDTQHIHLLRVEPLEAIRNTSYFSTLLEKAEKKRREAMRIKNSVE